MSLDLSGFHGSESFFRHWTGLLYTEGVKAMAEQAGAYWLIDAVASYQRTPKVKKNFRLQEFQLWKLTLDKKGGAELSLFEDSGMGATLTQKIEWTDFPEDIQLYVEGGVLMLPQER